MGGNKLSQQTATTTRLDSNNHWNGNNSKSTRSVIGAVLLVAPSSEREIGFKSWSSLLHCWVPNKPRIYCRFSWLRSRFLSAIVAIWQLVYLALGLFVSPSPCPFFANPLLDFSASLPLFRLGRKTPVFKPTKYPIEQLSIFTASSEANFFLPLLLLQLQSPIDMRLKPTDSRVECQLREHAHSSPLFSSLLFFCGVLLSILPTKLCSEKRSNSFLL